MQMNKYKNQNERGKKDYARPGDKYKGKGTRGHDTTSVNGKQCKILSDQSQCSLFSRIISEKGRFILQF